MSMMGMLPAAAALDAARKFYDVAGGGGRVIR